MRAAVEVRHHLRAFPETTESGRRRWAEFYADPTIDHEWMLAAVECVDDELERLRRANG